MKPGPKPKEKEKWVRVRVYGKCYRCGARGDVNLGKVCDSCVNELNDEVREAVRRAGGLPPRPLSRR